MPVALWSRPRRERSAGPRARRPGRGLDDSGAAAGAAEPLGSATQQGAHAAEQAGRAGLVLDGAGGVQHLQILSRGEMPREFAAGTAVAEPARLGRQPDLGRDHQVEEGALGHALDRAHLEAVRGEVLHLYRRVGMAVPGDDGIEGALDPVGAARRVAMFELGGVWRLHPARLQRKRATKLPYRGERPPAARQRSGNSLSVILSRMKAMLISLAALTVFDAVAWHSAIRARIIGEAIRAAQMIAALDWSWA